MKKLYIIFFFALFSCRSESSSKPTYNEKDTPDLDFDWLLGDWIRTNEDGDKDTFESWAKVNASVYQGFGFTLIKTDTVWQEEMRLIKIGEGWSLEVTGKGESDPTVFQLTELSQNSFTSQNPEHDFPTEIRYFKSGEFLKAIVSGNELEIPFEFERREH